MNRGSSLPAYRVSCIFLSTQKCGLYAPLVSLTKYTDIWRYERLAFTKRMVVCKINQGGAHWSPRAELVDLLDVLLPKTAKTRMTAYYSQCEES